MWGIVAFFAYDNILEWMRHPLVMVFVMIVFVTMGYLFASGKLYVMSNLYQFAYSFAMSIVMGTQRPNVSMIWQKKNENNIVIGEKPGEKINK